MGGSSGYRGVHETSKSDSKDPGKICQNPFNSRREEETFLTHTNNVKKAEPTVLVDILGEVTVMGAYRNRVCKAQSGTITKPSLSPLG